MIFLALYQEKYGWACSPFNPGVVNEVPQLFADTEATSRWARDNGQWIGEGGWQVRRCRLVQEQ